MRQESDAIILPRHALWVISSCGGKRDDRPSTFSLNCKVAKANSVFIWVYLLEGCLLGVRLKGLQEESEPMFGSILQHRELGVSQNWGPPQPDNEARFRGCFPISEGRARLRGNWHPFQICAYWVDVSAVGSGTPRVNRGF